ncbi:pilus assembly protein PilP [Pseudomonas sp. C27(2019)]|uniref:pilus assembly protein PilP n=1 Tax=Pseudomonas sp. C27(2019) TaxID=2604941 RepID=UPI0012459EA4|nr:pilus assembly protein PilP [Pseudomonas sp. C27(2019)]QEY57823.1 pilus assembly protein PilP [Pseudomonas sp. C27(2019)]
MKRSHYVLTAVLALSLTGCGSSDGFADLQVFMDEVRSRPKGSIEPMPKEVVYEPFTYVAATLRSPFQPPVKIELSSREKGSKDIEPDETRVKQFLEGFNIESFVMVGTLSNEAGTYALLRGGNGVHRVRIGDYLGGNHGRVTAITTAGIEVIEIVSDGDGGWLERPRTLALQERS